MTRREQIEQVAHLIKGKSRNREFIAFVQGALWADAHISQSMQDVKICKIWII